MKSGTEKNPNPHEASLGAFLRALEGPATSRTRRLRSRRRPQPKVIHEPPERHLRTKKAAKRIARSLAYTRYEEDRDKLKDAADSSYLALWGNVIPMPVSMPDRQLAMWKLLRRGAGARP